MSIDFRIDEMVIDYIRSRPFSSSSIVEGRTSYNWITLKPVPETWTCTEQCRYLAQWNNKVFTCVRFPRNVQSESHCVLAGIRWAICLPPYTSACWYQVWAPQLHLHSVSSSLFPYLIVSLLKSLSSRQRHVMR